MIFFAFRHHRDDERCAERRITRFVDGFVITTGSDRPLLQYGAETLAPPLQSQKNATVAWTYGPAHAYPATQDVLQLFTR